MQEKYTHHLGKVENAEGTGNKCVVCKGLGIGISN